MIVTVESVFANLYFNNSHGILGIPIDGLGTPKCNIALGPLNMPGDRSFFGLLDDNLPVTFQNRVAQPIIVPIHIPDTDTCIRALSEKFIHNSLTIQVQNGQIGIQINNFKLMIDFNDLIQIRDSCPPPSANAQKSCADQHANGWW